MNRQSKWYFWRGRWAAFLHDLLWIPVCVWMAFQLRFNFESMDPAYRHAMIWMVVVAVPVQTFFFWVFGLYRGVWRFASMPDLVRILQGVLIGALCLFAVFFLAFRLENVPRSVFFLYPLLLASGLSGPRLLYRWLKDRGFRLRRGVGQRALIVGTNRAGELLARDLLRQGQLLPVGFVDDSPRMVGREIHGIRVQGRVVELEQLVKRLAVDVVLIAIPAAKRQVINHVVDVCSRFKVTCKILPSLMDLAVGKITMASLRPVQVEDLLGRDPVRLDDQAVSGLIQGKVVLVTGGGGSIGSELCRQVAALNPSRLVIFESNEFNLYSIDLEMSARFPELALETILGDVKDVVRVQWVFEYFKPDVVFHSAAYKHVPMVEKNPAEGIHNNVLGTKVVADAADWAGCERFVMVSTDKAVNPTNIMGASKRVGEIYCQNLNTRSKTRFITTRFGNVLGSAGSVVPLFRKQIEAGGPVTVTHPDITRYFMTIPEAVSLILEAGAMGKGGEIFVLNMGEPVRIKDLAERMIRLSGLEPGVDVEILFTGLRPGEKMFEELFHEGEGVRGTHHPDLMLAPAREVDFSWLAERILNLVSAARSRDLGTLYTLLLELVPESRVDVPKAGVAPEVLRKKPQLKVVKGGGGLS